MQLLQCNVHSQSHSNPVAAGVLVRPRWSAAVILLAMFATTAHGQEDATGSAIVRDIGNRRELFVDDWLIASRQNVELRLHPPTPREVALSLDQPWAGPTCGFTCVFKDEDRYRLYYSSDSDGATPNHTSYAESRDGIDWTTPNLGLIEFEGSSENNLIWRGEGIHSFSAFRDTNPDAAPEQRYKALGGSPPQLFASPDAIHWVQIQEAGVLLDGPSDSQNLAFWDSRRGLYVAYARLFLNGAIRHIRTATSPDFINWSPSKPIDFGSAPLEHLYTNAITPYFRAPHIYVGFPMRFVEERTLVPSHPYPGISDGVFISSRDGLHFDRRFLEAFVEPGIGERNWTDRTNLPAWGVVPTGEHEMSVYWVEHFRHPTIALRRGTLRLDGFVSINAPPGGGNFTTWPLRFEGAGLAINFRTSARGALRIAVLNANDEEIPGFGLADCDEIYGNEIERRVTWKGGDLTALPGHTIQLKFAMQDADLYSLQFVP